MSEPLRKKRKVSDHGRWTEDFYRIAQAIPERIKQTAGDINFIRFRLRDPKWPTDTDLPDSVTKENLMTFRLGLEAYLKDFDIRLPMAVTLQEEHDGALITGYIHVRWYYHNLKERVGKEAQSTLNPAVSHQTRALVNEACFPGMNESLASLVCDYTVDPTLLLHFIPPQYMPLHWPLWQYSTIPQVN